MSDAEVLAIPIKLDAFVLNAAVCGGPDVKNDLNKDKAKIAPLTQPNYTFLRLEQQMVQNDVLEYTDLHKTSPAPYNTRFTDLGNNTTRANRQGVYVHWMVPRPYRTGSKISKDPQAPAVQKNRAAMGLPPHGAGSATTGDASGASGPVPEEAPPPVGDTAAPDYHPAPARWLVIRKVETSDPQNVLPEVFGWVVESNRRRVLDDVPLTEDVQVDIAPYIYGGSNGIVDGEELAAQAEVFIGHKEPATSWSEQATVTTDDNKPIDETEKPARVSLNLVSSSNQLFPDFQPHNGNVFSMVDTLDYPDPAYPNDPTKKLVVKTATVSYYVLGWHSNDEYDQDPFQDLKDTTRGERLSALNMVLNDTDEVTKQGVDDWLKSPNSTSIMCHGAMYNVLWDIDNKPPIVPADTYFEKLNKDMPVSVGTTPMDALLNYVKSHSAPNSDEPTDIKEVEHDLMLIQKLLHARDDGVDSQNEADDIVYNWNYARTAGGGHYFLAGSDGGKGDKGQPTQPDPKYITQLRVVNSEQRYLDALDRNRSLLRWDMFSIWWQYMTDLPNPDVNKTKAAAGAKNKEIVSISNQISLVNTAVTKSVRVIPAGMIQMGVLPSFSQGRDPTMLVAGIESGWPWDYLQQLKSRIGTQLYVSGSQPPLDEAWSTFCKQVLPKLPSTVQTTAQALVQEFLTLNPQVSPTPPAAPGALTPLYHDLDKTHFLPDNTPPWRDRWEKSQAWFPLYLEWEAEYTHVPYILDEFDGQKDKHVWPLGPRSAWESDPTKLRYGIASDVELATLKIQDKRTVSGRVLILPQPNFNLQTIVQQILENTPDLDSYLTKDQQEELKDHIADLAFLSSPLSGFTEHLLTRVQGNHVKPTVRIPNSGDAPIPLKAAVDVGTTAGLGGTELTQMGIETDLTPYGNLVPYLGDGLCPFKPVTHGQFRFTALNIIDKFGQAIHAIDPTPPPIGQGPPPLYPCISEFYTPQGLNKDPTTANTVVQDPPNLCQYVQLPPTINQPARLNSAFVEYSAADPKSGDPAGWRPLDEWENPVWGWVVPNYADQGFQLFLEDGTFFREIRLGGPAGGSESDAWLPLQPPPTPNTNPKVKQLQLFADQLAKADYLTSFAAMLRTSLNTTAPPPTAYGQFLSALIGKPLALVNASYSLELATKPLSNTCTLSGIKQDPDIPLLPTKADPDNHYTFALQLGDRDRVYDGLVAYFHQSASPTAGDALDLSTLYTHFIPDPSPPPHVTKIEPENYPVLSPFWIDPMSTGNDGILIPNDPAGSATAYNRAWVSKFQPTAIGALIDPFVPLHAYSGILPTGSLQLPPWTWQKALERMTAFFHMGPLLITQDVPAFSPTKVLGNDYDLAKDSTLVDGNGIGVPSMQAGEWAWLQGYSVQGNKESGGVDAQTDFMALGMAAVDTRPRFEPAPYVAVEGYMQLREAIGQAVEPPST